jgi:hypothetical protein
LNFNTNIYRQQTRKKERAIGLASASPSAPAAQVVRRIGWQRQVEDATISRFWRRETQLVMASWEERF